MTTRFNDCLCLGAVFVCSSAAHCGESSPLTHRNVAALRDNGTMSQFTSRSNNTHWLITRVLLGALCAVLTSCTSMADVPNTQGAVVLCSSLPTTKAPLESPILLDCLGGGPQVDLQSIQGPAVVHVWGSWCAECVAEIPIFKSFYESKDPAVTLFGVDTAEVSKRDGLDFVLTHGVTWPQLSDPNSLSKSVAGNGVPVTLFISNDGTISGIKYGPIKTIVELVELTQRYLNK